MLEGRHTIVLVLVAMFVFSLVAADSASAAVTLLAEWLVEGKPVLTLTSVIIAGEVLLEDTSNKTGITCSRELAGSVGPSGEAEVTAVQNLTGIAVGELGGSLLPCKSETICENSGTDVLAAPRGLPWHTLAYLEEATKLFRYLLFSAGYDVECLVLGIKIVDECTSTNASDELVNNATSVEAVGALTPLGTCSIGGAGTENIENVGTNSTLTLTGQAVFISSEA
jgi:hypothetical protein